METKRKSFRVGMFAVLFAASILFAPQAQAGYWGEPTMAAILKESLEKIARQIEGVMLGALKASAIQLLNSQVGQLIGGSSAGGSAIISDWRQWLYDVPEQKVQVAQEQFFNSVLRGRDSSSYNTMLADQDAGVNNYYEMLADQMKGFDTSGDLSANAAELAGGDPIAELGKGNLKALNALFVKPTNNPFGLALAYESEMQSVREKAETEQVIKSIASGYKPIESNGMTILPGSTIGAMVADANDIGNKVIAGASNPGELASGIIVSLVNKTITSTIQKGIGNVQANIQREIGNVDRQISGQVQSLNQTLGPAAGFVREVRQQTNVIVKPATNPGAAIPMSYDP